MDKAAETYVAATGALIRPNVLEPFVVGLCTASPEFFRQPGQVAGEWDPERTEAFITTTIEYLQKRFGADLVHADADFDESTPHVGFCVVGLHRYRTKRGKERIEVSPRQLFPGEKSWAIEQDRYAAALAHLGIERGARGSGANHEDPQAYKRRLAREADGARQAAVEAQEAAAFDRVNATLELADAKASRVIGENRRHDAAESARRADALATGLTAIGDGRIEDGIMKDGRKVLAWRADVTPSDQEQISRQIGPAWKEVWQFARAIAAAIRRRLQAASRNLARGLETLAEERSRLRSLANDIDAVRVRLSPSDRRAIDRIKLAIKADARRPLEL